NYLCVKLGATEGPLKVRLVQVNRNGSLGVLPPGPKLQVRRLGFTGENDTRQEIESSDNASSFDSSKSGGNKLYDRIAFVTVRHDGKDRVQIPIVILGDEPILVSVTL